MARSKSDRALLRKAESSAPGTIPPGLRAILERCLDPDPGQRYRRGLDLAEDLDRWRCDRPLVGATEPLWGQTVPRMLRRQRTAILAAALSLAVIGATTAVALVKSQRTLRSLALHRIGRLWDDPEARAYRFQRTNYPRLLQPDDSRVETAARALKEYDVLGHEDWRRRDDVRTLPETDRKDLDVWLMEQTYLYCRSLADRPESPKDWSRAVKILDHVGAHTAIPAFAPLRERLLARLQGKPPIPQPAAAGAAESSVAPRYWANEYLLGVVAECALESVGGDAFHAPAATGRDGVESTGVVGFIALDERTQRAAERALASYGEFLTNHPDSFWGNYRAAAVSYGLGGRVNFAKAAIHLQKCLHRRPNNPMLHNHFAATLMAHRSAS